MEKFFNGAKQWKCYFFALSLEVQIFPGVLDEFVKG